MHYSSFQAMKRFKEDYLDVDSKLDIIDIGAYDSSDNNYNYGSFLNEKNWNYNGMDIREGPNVDIAVSDIYNWSEIRDESFDVVVSGQAFEHMEFFWLIIEEMYRILKPGGYCCIIAPSSGPVHRNPFDCFRFKDNGMKAIGDYVGLTILEYYTNTSGEAIPWHDSVLIARKD